MIQRVFEPLLVVCLVSLCWLCASGQAQAAPGRTYAVIVANNGSVDPDVEPLRYADDDGARYWELFSAVADEVTLLTTLDAETQRVHPKLAPHTEPPTRRHVRERLAQVRRQLAQDREAGLESSLYVIFVGHGAVDEGGMGYLSLLDGRYTRQELVEDLLQGQSAHRVHLIIDACHAWFMLHERGGAEERAERSGQSWDEDFAAFLGSQQVQERHPGLGVILSTSGAAEVHEWSRYRGGVFSHEVRSGLLGAADVDGDLQVTYPELEAWLAAANASVLHPRARIQFYTRGPRQDQNGALLSLRRLAAGSLLQIPARQAGRYHIEDSRGLRYADFHSAGDGPVHLALLPQAPHYFVRRGDSEARVSPQPEQDHPVELSEGAFVPSQDQTGQRGGAVEESYRRNLFATPYGRSFFAGYQAGRQPGWGLGVGRGASLPSPPSPWELRAGLGFSGAQLSERAGQSLQTTLELSAGWHLQEDLWLELIGQYGTSAHTLEEQALTQHRPALGAGLRYELPLADGWALSLSGRSFYQWLIFDGQQRLGDKLSWRGEAWGGLERQLGERWTVGLRAGYGLSVISVAQTSDGKQLEPVWDGLWQAGLVLGWR